MPEVPSRQSAAHSNTSLPCSSRPKADSPACLIESQCDMQRSRPGILWDPGFGALTVVKEVKESYRVVGKTLIINKPGYSISGNQMVAEAEDFSAVLMRMR